MELNITKFFNNADHWHLCNSVAVLGNNAAKITWQNAQDSSNDFTFVTESNKSEFVDYFKQFGAWSREELENFSLVELNALLLQFISSDINDLDMFEDDNGELNWGEIESAQESGTISSNIFKSEYGEYFYYIDY